VRKNSNKMEFIDPSMLEDENGIIEDVDYDNGYEGNENR
jgi:hypothetical protein